MQLNSLESIIAVEGKLPFNIIFLAEGDEILGVPVTKCLSENTMII